MMALALLASLALLPAHAGAPARTKVPACWSSNSEFRIATIENPAKNFSVLFEPRRFREVCGAGKIVTNGTFFVGPEEPLGDIIIDGHILFSPTGSQRQIKKADRWIDLGQRWGFGVLKDSETVAIADGDSALLTMKTYMGGGGLLLENGRDVTKRNETAPKTWGPSFPWYVLNQTRTRTAVGYKTKNGRQLLILLSVRPFMGATIRELAQIMMDQGATDAVFYDGGGAAAFAAGGKCLQFPSNSNEDLNPTHIVIDSCR